MSGNCLRCALSTVQTQANTVKAVFSVLGRTWIRDTDFKNIPGCTWTQQGREASHASTGCDDKILSRQPLLRYCAWSSSFDLLEKCLSHPGHTRQSFAMWQDTGLRCPCARILWVAAAFGPLFKNLLHLGHVLCSTVNGSGAPERSMFPHSSASTPKSSLGSSHQPSVLALASIVFHLPRRKTMSDTHAGQSSKGVSKIGFFSKFADSNDT